MATDLTKQNRRLDAIASQLKKIHGEFLALAGRSLGMAKTVGDLLVEAKSLVEHGDWSAWLETNFPGSERSAQGYMRLASKWEQIDTKSAETADLTLDAALKLLAKPKPEPANRACANCGGTTFDEDGDCTSCFDPPPDDDPAESPTTPQDATEDEDDSEGEEAEEEAGDGEPSDKEPFGEQLWLVVTRFWKNQYPEVPAITVADYLEEIRERVLNGEK
jgi:hypothetical protein